LVCKEKCGSASSERIVISYPNYPFSHTSNDLLFRLDEEPSRKALNYEVIAQSAEEVQEIQNAPAISMGPI
jgi:hypothetical protein